MDAGMPLQDIGTDVRTPAALAEHSGVRSGFLQRLLPKLLPNRPWNLITAPVIYSMIVPLLILDLFVSLYQATCFPIYGIARVCRGDYIIFDRQHLAYLDAVDKVHCSYCAYGTGLIAYVNEIVARTENYFCPIKHARSVVRPHSRYARFLDYGDAADYATRLEAIRAGMDKPASAPKQSSGNDV